MMFTCDLACPLCCGPLTLVAKSTPNTYHAAFAVACKACRREMLVKIDLSLSYKPDTNECGSMAGYNRHLRRNESSCKECADARNEYERERRRQHRLQRDDKVMA